MSLSSEQRCHHGTDQETEALVGAGRPRVTQEQSANLNPQLLLPNAPPFHCGMLPPQGTG